MSRTVLLAVAATLQACTIVSLTGVDGGTRVESHFGFVSIQLGSDRSAVIAEVQTIGAMQGPAGFVLGGTRQRWVKSSPDACNLTLWVEDARQLETLREMIGSSEQICVVP